MLDIQNLNIVRYIFSYIYKNTYSENKGGGQWRWHNLKFNFKFKIYFKFHFLPDCTKFSKLRNFKGAEIYKS